jgi:HD-GYP domain-containing protein (c-di-GMP phosphodiesterase class II)
MDKKKEINFNLNNFLLALSLPLDYVKMYRYSTSLNYSKRVAYLALNIGKALNLKPEEMSDLCSYSLIHSIGLLNTKNISKEYCESSNDIANSFPFLVEQKDILKYQNEYYDGSGIFGLKSDEIPLLSQILSFAMAIENKFDLSSLNAKSRPEVTKFVENNKEKLFSKEIVEIFLEISSKISFWLDLNNENEILYFIFANLHDFTTVLKFEDLLKITSKIYLVSNENPKLIEYSEKMVDFYKFEHKDKYTFLIATTLCKIGKLFIPLEIINKSSALEDYEYEEVKSYPYYTNKVLNNIMGFNDINSWASKVQERCNNEGYPLEIGAKDLSLKDRLIAILIAYDSLKTANSYRSGYSHEKSIEILKEMAKKGQLDSSIVEDVNNILK